MCAPDRSPALAQAARRARDPRGDLQPSSFENVSVIDTIHFPTGAQRPTTGGTSVRRKVGCSRITGSVECRSRNDRESAALGILCHARSAEGRPATLITPWSGPVAREVLLFEPPNPPARRRAPAHYKDHLMRAARE